MTESVPLHWSDLSYKKPGDNRVNLIANRYLEWVMGTVLYFGTCVVSIW